MPTATTRTSSPRVGSGHPGVTGQPSRHVHLGRKHMLRAAQLTLLGGRGRGGDGGIVEEEVLVVLMTVCVCVVMALRRRVLVPSG